MAKYTPKASKKAFTATEGQPDLIFKDTGEVYSGVDYFYDPFKNKYFTGKSTYPAPIQRELETGYSDIEEGDNQRPYVKPLPYDLLKGDSLGYDIRITTPVPRKEQGPTPEELSRPIHIRYFAQHRFSGEIIETYKEDYQKLLRKEIGYHYPSYIIGRTYWRTAGPVANTTLNGYIVQGAQSDNELFISQLEETLPNIRTYLTDPTQFVE